MSEPASAEWQALHRLMMLRLTFSPPWLTTVARQLADAGWPTEAWMPRHEWLSLWDLVQPFMRDQDPDSRYYINFCGVHIYHD